MSAGGLLDAAFLKQLEALRRRLQSSARSAQAGERVALRRGSSAEFKEHRAYEPGDDLRRIDWMAFARKGAPVVKLFHAEDDFIVRLLLDASASLGFGDPAKIDVARRLGAALGYMALRNSQRAQVLVARRPRASEAGRALFSSAAPRRGRAGLPGLFRDLEAVTAGDSGDYARAIAELLAGSQRPGLIVLLSDFYFDPEALGSALARATAMKHDLALVQIVTEAELHPELSGDCALEDSETGSALDVTIDADALDAYTRRLNALIERLRVISRKHGACYVRALNTEPLEAVVRRILARSVD